MATKNNRVETLLKQHATVENATLKAAMKEVAEKEATKQKEELVRAWDHANRGLEYSLEVLRKCRKKEKIAKKLVEAEDAAIEQFKKDGDISALNKAIREANVEFQKNF